MDIDDHDIVHGLPDIDTPPTTPHPVVDVPVQEMDKLNFGDHEVSDELLDGPIVDVPLGEEDRILADDPNASNPNSSRLETPDISIRGETPLRISGDVNELNVEPSEL